MVSAIDRIIINVPGLAEAGAQYEALLGIEPRLVGDGESSSIRFELANTAIELVPGIGGEAVIQGLAFVSAGAGSVDTPIENHRGLDIRLCTGARAGARKAQPEGMADSPLGVDHIVLRTSDAADCIDLFGTRLGIRLALDKTVPQWGGRMLFFRTGKVTLEVMEGVRDVPEADHFWGIAYQCHDIDVTAGELARRGVALSEIRVGRKPGTRVATVKSHCLGLPTLLLQQGSA